MNRLSITWFLVLIATGLQAQQQVKDADLNKLVRLQINYQRHFPIEKLYIQTDKPNYAVGDTIWFKSYLFSADYLKYPNERELLYMELADANNDVVLRRLLPTGYGIGYGQIAINGKDIPEGSYTLRAYTNWQRNFGEDYIFSKRIYITASMRQPWLVNIKSSSTKTADKETIQSELMFTDAGNPLRLREMELRVKDKNKTLLRGQSQTDMSGSMAVNFTLPSTANSALNLQIADLRKGEGNQQQNVPIVLARPENTDVQFMPEGGSLVAGIPTRVGFKAIGEDSRGVDVHGIVLNSRQETVASFTASHKGMGNFLFVPKAGESYMAKIELPGKIIKTYTLPVVKNTGTVLNVQTITDSLKIKIASSEDNGPEAWYLVAEARGVICYAEQVKLSSSGKVVTLPQSLFPTGITRFSLLNKQGQPFNERIVYIDHQDNLQIKVSTEKLLYTARDSVAMHISVTDKDGKPIAGSFSLAVTDNDQVAIDTLSSRLTTNLLLTSDLKGTIEDPYYYLQNGVLNKQALDNLLLTQGWVGYSWTQITGNIMAPKFDIEPEFAIKGKITNILNKPVAHSTVMLVSKKPNVIQIDETDDTGQFIFGNLPVTDTAVYFIEGTNKRNKNFGIGVLVNPFLPQAFSKPKEVYLPWYVNTDSLLQRSVSQNLKSRLEADKISGKNVLQEVEIKAKKIVPGSHNLNGPGEADVVLNEKDMDKAQDSTLEQLLTRYLPGGLRVQRLVRKKISPYREGFYYMTANSRVNLVIDGFDVQKLITADPLLTEGWVGTIMPYLSSLTAKEIKGIEIIQSLNYRLNYDPPSINRGAISEETIPRAPVMYIEITTHSGLGPYYTVTPGTYVYKPLPFIVTRQFYSPKYIDKANAGLKDLRATIYWNPLVVTDEQGKATLSFYTSDKPNNYNIVIEGGDMNGKIGSIVQKINTPMK